MSTYKGIQNQTNEVYYLMTTYRFLAFAMGQKIKCEVQASSDQEAKELFVKKLGEGDFEKSPEGTYRKDLLIVTYEELKHGS